MISGGAEAADRIQRIQNFDQLDPSQTEGVLGSAAYTPGIGFDAYNFDDNATETGGWLFIPPDPMGAAGVDRLVSVTNVGIECRTKAGVLLWRDSLQDFFSFAPNTLGTFTFDPKVVYDEHAGRFVVITLERTDVQSGGAADASRIHIAVSKTSSPASATNADWWYESIDSKLVVGATELWADYPGLEVDEEAVYITMSFFNFLSYASAYDQRLYIVHKGLVGGFYAGGAATITFHDPYTAVGQAGFKTTTMPCQVHGAAGVAPGVGTYLLSYSGLTYGGLANPEAIFVIRVDNPTGVVGFVQEFVTINDIEDIGGALGWPALPDAPQPVTATPIEVNDRRTLDCVWRNGYIYMTTTINPNAYDPANQGTTTAHLVKLDATAVTGTGSPAGLITLAAETDIGAEDIAINTFTYFPSVAVNNLNHVKVGFSGSAETVFGSAFAAEIVQATFTPQPTATVRAGVDWYVRTFAPGGNGRNRWGDYSGISWDPADGTTFWVYNEWAMTRGTPTNTPAPVVVEDGRWSTAWLSCVQVPTEDFGDAPDPTYPTLLASNGARHTLVQGIFLGALIDPEVDGQPHPNALGDDINNQPDEDGVNWVTPLAPGLNAQVDVVASVAGWVDLWIDADLSGSWDPPELVWSGPVAPGLNNLFIVVPSGGTGGYFSFARVRYNTGGSLPVTGPAADGEVEDYEVWIDEAEVDFGDAPDPTYPTLLASNGARHAINPNVFMGALIDAEPDGQPDPNAKGDDLNNQPDEDGVIWVTPIIPNNNAQFDVTVSLPGWVDAWIDFDLSGLWDAGELIYSGPVNAGLNNIPYFVPAGALGGRFTFARVRYNLNGPLPPDGSAPDGEVEDYEVFIEENLDFGDAPDAPYPTLLGSNGARHVIVPGVFLGALIDAEPDGQPDATATGDDLSNQPDEDGVTWSPQLATGGWAQMSVTASVAGHVDAWIDYDMSGTWDAGELIYSGPVIAGFNGIGFNIPTTAIPGQTFARVRYNLAGPLNPDGWAPDGEVEDYMLEIEPGIDFGDAPDPTYPTLLASTGASHAIVPGVFLGNRIDAEPDGQPNANATGDDVSYQPDEDGVVWTTLLVPGQPASFDVTASVNGWVDAWVDFDLNGAWDPTDQIYSGPVVAGLNSLPFNVPATAASGLTFARVRYNAGGVAYPVTGFAPDGEVEDYEVKIEEPDLDFGDAPDPPYPTFLVNNGARHLIVPGVFLGNLIDAEPDGQPNANATGDDLANQPDEDGVNWVTPIVVGQNAQMDVTASMNGQLDAWIDFNLSGTWDPGELIYSGFVAAGLNNIPFAVPAAAVPGITFARVRYNVNGAVMQPTGFEIDGEVEDYEVRVDPGVEEAFGDAPDPTYRTLLASNGARHVIVAGVFLGNLIDGEADGQPNANATGDDIAGLPDEDGVTWITPLATGGLAQIDVVASVPGWVDAWIDFNGNGVWDHPAELIYSGPVIAGNNNILFGVPTTAVPGANTFARIRYNLGGPLPPDGPAPDGEVEDYEVFIEQGIDFGDAPDPPYPTLAANSGAWHLIVPGVFLGGQVDAEPDGQPDPNALGDDVNYLDDGDGVSWPTPIVPGNPSSFDVFPSVPGWVDAWIDFDLNGAWDPTDQIYSGPVVAGINTLNFVVPPTAVPGQTFARVRFNLSGPLPPTGPAPDGEVEDYEVFVEPGPDADFGDAPDPTYPTTLASGGARHAIVPGILLGTQIDAEPNGQPHPQALGDDIAGLPDEDGVVWTPWKPGQVTQVTVFPSVPGWVDMWVDFDASGVWDPPELVYSGPVPGGPFAFNVFVPGGSTVGFTFARVRYNTVGPLPVGGAASDGEVEDYEVRIDPPDLDFGDAPDSYTTLLASNGPRHVINTGVFMGALIDPEPDGQPSPLADRDDIVTSDDEDGVVIVTPPVVGLPFQVDVTVSVAGWVDMWIDYNQNGVFDHPAELVYSANVAAGLNSFNVNVPAGTPTGWTYVRVRYNLIGALTPSGFAPDGEVEDYRIRIISQTGLPGDGRLQGFGAAYPNPFSDRVTVSFGLPAEEMVVVEVYSMDGALVTTLAREWFGPGQYALHWDGRNDRGQPVTSGVYFFRMQAGKMSQNQKVLFVR